MINKTTHIIAFVVLLGILISVCLASCNPYPADGFSEEPPFGIDYKTHPTEYGCVAINQHETLYSFCEDIPNPHPVIKEYYLTYYDDEEYIRLIVAKGKTHDNDMDGSDVRNDVDVLAKHFANKYGKWDWKNTWRDGNDLTESWEWAAGIRWDAREYRYSWNRIIPHGITAFFIEAKALSSQKTYTRIWIRIESDEQEFTLY